VIHAEKLRQEDIVKLRKFFTVNRPGFDDDERFLVKLNRLYDDLVHASKMPLVDSSICFSVNFVINLHLFKCLYSSPAIFCIVKLQKLDALDSTTSIVDIVKRNTLSVNDIFLECSFGRTPVNCTDIVTKIFDFNTGVCFTIDVGQPQTVFKIFFTNFRQLSLCCENPF